MKMRKNSGFTIVELLIVIVVIGILAAIVIVAYNGVQTRAQQSSITAETKQWAKLFEAYKAVNGSYPSPSATPATGGGGPGSAALNFYCLGTGFPKVSGTGYCFDTRVGSTTNYVAESTGTSLQTQLATVGTPPTNTTKYSYSGIVGPVLQYVSTTEMRIYAIYAPNTTCPSGMAFNYGDTTHTQCYIPLLSN